MDKFWVDAVTCLVAPRISGVGHFPTYPDYN